ncbi:hypothetical protein ACFSJQ_07130 [Vibrio olivae]
MSFSWVVRGAVALFCLWSTIAAAVTVTDSRGEFSLDYQPQRIVALEFRLLTLSPQ